MAAKVTIPIPEWVDRVCTWPVMVYRKHKYGWTFRRIYLGEGEWTILDNEDYYRLCESKWVISGNGRKYYAIRLVKKGPGKTRIEYMHRVIMQPGEGLLVDHKNRKPLDNRKENLRAASHSQNCCNQPKRANTSSRFTGATLDKRCGRWEGQIYVNGKRIRLGRFDNEEDAARAYDEAAKKYHGKFRKLNFPENTDLHPSSPPATPGQENTNTDCHPTSLLATPRQADGQRTEVQCKNQNAKCKIAESQSDEILMDFSTRCARSE